MFQFLKRFNDEGELIPIRGRKAIPMGHKRPESLSEQVARLVRNSEFARMVAAQGLETFEEADDFEVDDDIPLPNTPWERDHDLANIGAMHGGVVNMPSEDQLAKGRSTLQKARDAVSKRKSGGSATPPAKAKESDAPEPKNSESDDSE